MPAVSTRRSAAVPTPRGDRPGDAADSGEGAPATDALPEWSTYPVSAQRAYPDWRVLDLTATRVRVARGPHAPRSDRAAQKAARRVLLAGGSGLATAQVERRADAFRVGLVALDGRHLLLVLPDREEGDTHGFYGHYGRTTSTTHQTRQTHLCSAASGQSRPETAAICGGRLSQYLAAAVLTDTTPATSTTPPALGAAATTQATTRVPDLDRPTLGPPASWAAVFETGWALAARPGTHDSHDTTALLHQAATTAAVAPTLAATTAPLTGTERVLTRSARAVGDPAETGPAWATVSDLDPPDPLWAAHALSAGATPDQARDLWVALQHPLPIGGHERDTLDRYDTAERTTSALAALAADVGAHGWTYRQHLLLRHHLWAARQSTRTWYGNAPFPAASIATAAKWLPLPPTVALTAAALGMTLTDANAWASGRSTPSTRSTPGTTSPTGGTSTSRAWRSALGVLSPAFALTAAAYGMTPDQAITWAAGYDDPAAAEEALRVMAALDGTDLSTDLGTIYLAAAARGEERARSLPLGGPTTW